MLQLASQPDQILGHITLNEYIMSIPKQSTTTDNWLLFQAKVLIMKFYSRSAQFITSLLELLPGFVASHPEFSLNGG